MGVQMGIPFYYFIKVRKPAQIHSIGGVGGGLLYAGDAAGSGRQRGNISGRIDSRPLAGAAFGACVTVGDKKDITQREKGLAICQMCGILLVK